MDARGTKCRAPTAAWQPLPDTSTVSEPPVSTVDSTTMTQDDDPRLFDAGESCHRQGATARRRHLHSVEADDQLTVGHAAGNVAPAAMDGLLARPVKPHSARKAWAVRRYVDIVGQGIMRRWFPAHYAELFAGPGVLINENTGEEMLGSPLEALAIRKLFDGYVFADVSEDCADALDTRVGHLPNVKVLHGNANDPAHRQRVAALIPAHALLVLYLDPEGLELHFDAVRFFAQRFERLDLLINFHLNGVVRYLTAGGRERAVPMLDRTDPEKLIADGPRRWNTDVRAHHEEQLADLGLKHLKRMCVRTEGTKAALYDLVLASRNPKAVELFEKANRVEYGGQLGIAFQ